MNDIAIFVGIAIVVGLVSFFLFAYLGKKSSGTIIEQAKSEAKSIRAEAVSEAKIAKKEA